MSNLLVYKILKDSKKNHDYSSSSSKKTETTPNHSNSYNYELTVDEMEYNKLLDRLVEFLKKDGGDWWKGIQESYDLSSRADLEDKVQQAKKGYEEKEKLLVSYTKELTKQFDIVIKKAIPGFFSIGKVNVSLYETNNSQVVSLDEIMAETSEAIAQKNYKKLKAEEKLLEEEIIQLDKKFKKEEREYEEAYAHWEKLRQESNELKEKKKIIEAMPKISIKRASLLKDVNQQIEKYIKLTGSAWFKCQTIKPDNEILIKKRDKLIETKNAANHYGLVAWASKQLTPEQKQTLVELKNKQDILIQEKKALSVLEELTQQYPPLENKLWIQYLLDKNPLSKNQSAGLYGRFIEIINYHLKFDRVICESMDNLPLEKRIIHDAVQHTLKSHDRQENQIKQKNVR